LECVDNTEKILKQHSRSYCISSTHKEAGVGNLQHTCHTWHAKQFPVARRSSKFHISILLWVTRKVYWPWLASKNVYCWHTEWFETL